MGGLRVEGSTASYWLDVMPARIVTRMGCSQPTASRLRSPANVTMRPRAAAASLDVEEHRMDPYRTQGAFSWSELMTSEPEAALGFYTALLG